MLVLGLVVALVLHAVDSIARRWWVDRFDREAGVLDEMPEWQRRYLATLYTRDHPRAVSLYALTRLAERVEFAAALLLLVWRVQ